LCRQSRHGRIERPAAVSSRCDRLDAVACAACRWGWRLNLRSAIVPGTGRGGKADWNLRLRSRGRSLRRDVRGREPAKSVFEFSAARESTFAHVTLMSSSGLSDKCSALHDKTPLIRDPTGKSICTIFAFDRHKTPFGNAKSFAPKNSFRHTVQSDHLGHPLLPQNSSFAYSEIMFYYAVPPHKRGVSRPSRTLSVGCGGRSGLQRDFSRRRTTRCARRSRVVLASRCWRQAWR
jgi:hypothetical protein